MAFMRADMRLTFRKLLSRAPFRDFDLKAISHACLLQMFSYGSLLRYLYDSMTLSHRRLGCKGPAPESPESHADSVRIQGPKIPKYCILLAPRVEF